MKSNISLPPDGVMQEINHKYQSIATGQESLFLVAVSYNQPKLSPCATWSQNAITFASTSAVGNNPFGVFVNVNNTVYVPNRSAGSVVIWSQGNANSTTTKSGGLISPFSVFTTMNGDVYADNGLSKGRVSKWSLADTIASTALYVKGACYSLFVDPNLTTYCALNDYHRVVKQSLLNNPNASITVAGTGVQGSGPMLLSNPRGVIVDTRSNLYVADCANDRIQLFMLGLLNATTVVGIGAPGTIAINCPGTIVLDADGYLFIADSSNDRIVGSGPNGYRCVAGCGVLSGSGENQLNTPRGLSFDSFGNMYVADSYNDRIQKFLLATNSCGTYDLAYWTRWRRERQTFSLSKKVRK